MSYYDWAYDQILQILNGSRYEYNPIMMTVTAWINSYTFDEVSSILFTIEKNIEKQVHSETFSAKLLETS